MPSRRFYLQLYRGNGDYDELAVRADSQAEALERGRDRLEGADWAMRILGVREESEPAMGEAV